MFCQARKIAIVGGTGTIGSATLLALMNKNIHTITAISRKDSTAHFPDACIVKRGAYDDDLFLVSALQGQDVLVLQLGHANQAAQDGLIRAAAKVGVKYILPTEFGSDIEATQMIDDHPVVRGKAELRELVESVGSSWIAVVNNPWFDWSLAQGFWGIDIANRKATLYNGGNTKINTSTLKRVGEAVAELLSLPEEDLATYKNKPFYVSSFYVTQREMLESVQRVTSTTDGEWAVEELSITGLGDEIREEAQKGNVVGMIHKIYASYFQKDYGGDYNHKLTLGKFCLAPEDIDEVVKQVLG